MRLLMVEDNEMNQDMLARRLRRRGFEVEVASDASQGIDAARRLQPDLILMDIGLPGMDGCEATRVLKADSRTASIPVLALTAHAMSSDRDKALAAGCDGFECKPVELPRLLDAIARCAARRIGHSDGTQNQGS
jgi:CheY-like chemotaxis protein